MGLIINKKIPMFKVGYPTVSDKYNVSGGILAGSTAVPFGSLVIKDTATSEGCYFKAPAGMSSVAAIGGFALATNVKVPENWPGTTVQVNPGEAFNLMISGFMAVELDSGATAAQITPGATVCAIYSSGKLTTGDKASSGTIVAIPNVTFTGAYENHGTSASPKYVAEIYIRG